MFTDTVEIALLCMWHTSVNANIHHSSRFLCQRSNG